MAEKNNNNDKKEMIVQSSGVVAIAHRIIGEG